MSGEDGDFTGPFGVPCLKNPGGKSLPIWGSRDVAVLGQRCVFHRDRNLTGQDSNMYRAGFEQTAPGRVWTQNSSVQSPVETRCKGACTWVPRS